MIFPDHMRQEARNAFNVTRSESGVVLVIGLLLLAVLTIMALAGNSNTLIDTAIAFNNLAAIRSLYLAEAGLERGKLECVQRYLDGNWTSFNTILRGSDNILGTADDGIPGFGSSVSSHGGTYMVRATNDPNDGINDTNSMVRIMSTGSFGSSTTKLQIYLGMTLNPNVPAALTMVGEAEVFVADGVPFSIDGRDYRLADTDGFPSGTTAKLGIGVGNVDNVSWMNNTLNAVSIVLNSGLSNNAERQAVQGTGYNSGNNTPSVGQQNIVTKMSLRALADSLKAIADNLISYPPSFSGSSDASGNLSDWPSSGQTTCLGSAVNPKITYIDVTDNSIANTGISFAGTGAGGISGGGILVVDGSGLNFSGKVNWTGLVIVVGDFGSFGTGAVGGTPGTDLVRVRGGLMVGEYLTDQGSDEVSINTVTKLQYSTEAINMISNLLLSKPPYSVRAWQRLY